MLFILTWLMVDYEWGLGILMAVYYCRMAVFWVVLR